MTFEFTGQGILLRNIGAHDLTLKSLEITKAALAVDFFSSVCFTCMQYFFW
jgi:hypothetical protein